MTRASVRKLHYFSGVTLSIFIGVHLLNHLWSLAGADAHIALMQRLRSVYRHPLVETIILAAVLIQIVSGLRLLFFRRVKKTPAERIQIYSGLYLSFFLIAHVSAVIMGRTVEHLDTNFYFAAAGMNLSPASWFFIPYYFLGVCAISLHIAALHFLKTGSRPMAQLIAVSGILSAVLIIGGHTGWFSGLPIPGDYREFTERYFGSTR